MGDIKVLVMDVDGTLADGKMYISAQGEIFKAFDVKDGYGIHDMLPKVGILPVIISARESEIVKNRCNELGIENCYQGYGDKETALAELAQKLGIQPDDNGIYQEIAYIGDDVVDLPCMKRCGLIGCPSDAVAEVKSAARFVSSKKGGGGAVREFIEWITNKGECK